MILFVKLPLQKPRIKNKQAICLPDSCYESKQHSNMSLKKEQKAKEEKYEVIKTNRGKNN